MKSKFEKTIKAQLQRLKVVFWYEPLKLPYVITANYIPDFVIYRGSLKKPKKPLTKSDLKDTILVETKGLFDYADRIKMLAVKEAHPEVDLRIVFQSNSFVYKNRKKERRTSESTDMRYSDWADKHGFKYAIGEIPEVWLKEQK